MAQMNLSIKQRQTHRQRADLWLPRGSGEGVEWMEVWGLVDANYYIFFLWPHQHLMEVPRLGVKSDLQLPAYATAKAMPDLSICDLHCSSQQHQVLNPLNQAKDQISILVKFLTSWATTGAPKLLHFEWISNEVLLYSTGNHIQSLGIEHNGR